MFFHTWSKTKKQFFLRGGEGREGRNAAKIVMGTIHYAKKKLNKSLASLWQYLYYVTDAYRYTVCADCFRKNKSIVLNVTIY